MVKNAVRLESRVNRARDELKQMNGKKRKSGNFPKNGRSSLETMQKQLERIQQGKELNAIQQRRVALDNRMT